MKLPDVEKTTLDIYHIDFLDIQIEFAGKELMVQRDGEQSISLASLDLDAEKLEDFALALIELSKSARKDLDV